MSSNSLKEVILCRGVVDSNETQSEYIKTFETAGYTCKHLNVLRFEFLNLKRLRERLLLPNSYGGLIVTSRRTIEAIGSALQGHQIPNEWKKLPVFCVGPATSSFAEKSLNFENCLGSNCGNSRELANYIIKEISQNSKPLLYPCSAIARDTIEQTLNENQINIEKFPTYNTLPAENLENDLNRITHETNPTFVFFSPSAVEFTLAAAKEKNLNIQAVAIGPATADALTKAEIRVLAVSSKPEPESLLEAVINAHL
ncbi:uroporphyrinogen-III synthase [Venturia canescens]|uniref:uroporphyrinogen-III synthase n=1 Tax=Venturia canescens TaxID=32260 RepID=UPI001C9D3B97|nr:uroporphyrinogen-III synthase-like [Venturia canescens]